MFKLKFKIFMMGAIFQLIVLTGIAIAGILQHKYLETIFLLLSFFTLRYAFPKTYHCQTIKWCAFWSITLFWIAIPHTLPINISLFSSVIVGCALTHGLYLWQEFIELKAFKDKYGYVDFDHCTAEQIEFICSTLGYNKSKTELAKLFFVDKLSNEEVWKIMCSTQRNVAWDSVRQIKWRMHKDFQKFLDE